MTGDEYMALLEQRRQDYYTEHGQPRPGFPALLEWFVRDGDEALFTPPEPTKQPKRTPKPRTYRPASHWRHLLHNVQSRMDAINGITRHDTDDPAAYGGIGIRQTARQQQKYAARIDNAAAEYVRLEHRRNQYAAMLARAEEREGA